MNLKKAKYLRKLARDVHAELVERETAVDNGEYLVHKKRGYVVAHPASPRGIYRRIKKEVV